MVFVIAAISYRMARLLFFLFCKIFKAVNSTTINTNALRSFFNLKGLYPFLLALVYSFPAFSLPGSEEQSLPNILLLLADDMGYNDSPLYQELFEQKPVSEMPALMALAEQGVRYSRFYTESTCSSSRAALLTGQYPARHGFLPVARGISAEVETLPEYLKAKGYRTYHVGKWHLGEVNQEAYPLAQGFDSSFGFLGQWFLKGPDKEGNKVLRAPTYRDPWLEYAEGATVTYQQYPGHLTDILLDHTLQLLSEQQSEAAPWFIYHGFFTPHTPLQPDPRFGKKHSAEPAGRYQAMLDHLDFALAEIERELKQTGQWENTLIIFASDNGATGKHVPSNAPFEGSKNNYFEGGVRAPLVVKWPGGIELDSFSQKVISIMDIYPSIVALNGDDVGGFDGVPSLLDGEGVELQSLFNISYEGISAFDVTEDLRHIRTWEFREFASQVLYDYDSNTMPRKKGGWLNFSAKKQKNRLYEEFLHWRDTVRRVPVVFSSERPGFAEEERIEEEEAGLVGKLSAYDFLRSPVNPSYAIAVSFDIDENNMDDQVLLSQDGVMELLWHPAEKVIQATVYDQNLSAELTTTEGCHTAIISGAFFDRYSGLNNQIRPSQVSLVMDGKLAQSEEFEIPDLDRFDFGAATYVANDGVSQESVFSGRILDVQVYTMQILPDDKPMDSGITEEITMLCAAKR